MHAQSNTNCLVRCKGFSLIELMVAMALSLVLLAGVLSLFASSRTAYESNERLSRIQENGRFALDQIMRDIRSAGYLGCSHPAPFTNTLNAANALLWNFGNPIEGFEATGAGTWSPALDTALLPNPADASDVIAIRGADRDVQPQRLTTDLAASTDALQVPAAAVFLPPDQVAMVADCNGSSVFQVSGYAGGTIDHIATGTQPGKNSTQDLGYAYQTGADVFPVQTVIYYVSPSSIPNNGNSLWRVIGTSAPVELVEGIDSLQILYGIDANGDQIVEDYRAANLVTDWSQVMSVTLGILARSPSEYGTETDTQTYQLLNTPDTAVGPFNDRRQRLIFTTTTTIRNRAF